MNYEDTLKTIFVSYHTLVCIEITRSPPTFERLFASKIQIALELGRFIPMDVNGAFSCEI